MHCLNGALCAVCRAWCLGCSGAAGPSCLQAQAGHDCVGLATARGRLAAQAEAARGALRAASRALRQVDALQLKGGLRLTVTAEVGGPGGAGLRTKASGKYEDIRLLHTARCGSSGGRRRRQQDIALALGPGCLLVEGKFMSLYPSK